MQLSLRAAVSMAALGLAFANQAQAQPHPTTAPTDARAAPSSKQTKSAQDIVVVAERSEQSSIDRTTYIVKDNAEARASSALDLLGRVPSVDVSPSGAIRLIGRSGVDILIDGQQVPNADAFLRAMQGSEVAKIEVVTNPSAQISARATGGIINIITRRSSVAGLGGSVMAKARSLGSYEIRSSPSWTLGKLSLSGGIGIVHGESKGELEEERVSVEPSEDFSRFEREESRGDSNQVNASFRALVEIGSKQSISLDGMALDSDGRSFMESDVAEDGNHSEERSSAVHDLRSRRIAANYRRERSGPGAYTSLSVSYSSFGFTSSKRSIAEGNDQSDVFRISSDTFEQDAIVKADHVRPAGDRLVSIGGQFQHHVEDHRQQASISAPSATPVLTDDEFYGSWSEAEAYLSYQFPFQGNKILAGARISSRWHDILGTSDDPAAKTHIFPSLHVERKLSDQLTANLSYSSRIGWPGLAQLDPRLHFSDPETARAGNPSLRSEKTHSLELKLMAKAGRHEANLTSYVQRTRDLRSELAELDGDLLVSRPVNLGTRTSIGASLVVRGPLVRGLRYTASANLAQEKIRDAGLPGVDESGTGYGGSLQLNYRDGIEGKTGADQVRLTARYTGPSQTGFFHTSSFVRAEASWSHGISDRLAAVLTASHVMKSPKVSYTGLDVVSRSFLRSAGPIVSLALTYGLSPSGQ